MPLLLIIPVILVSGCVAQPSTQPPANQTPPSGSAITIKNFAFNPQSVTIKPGTTVTWTNEDSAPHTVTSDSGIFDSGQLPNGGSFSYTFNQNGRFDYHCSIHPYMKGSIIVG